VLPWAAAAVLEAIAVTAVTAVTAAVAQAVTVLAAAALAVTVEPQGAVGLAAAWVNLARVQMGRLQEVKALL
jgi:hypothetical protein